MLVSRRRIWAGATSSSPMNMLNRFRLSRKLCRQSEIWHQSSPLRCRRGVPPRLQTMLMHTRAERMRLRSRFRLTSSQARESGTPSNSGIDITSDSTTVWSTSSSRPFQTLSSSSPFGPPRSALPHRTAHTRYHQIPCTKHPSLAGAAAPLGDKDLGALLHLKTLVLLDADIQAGAQGVGLRLNVQGLGLDGIDEKDYNGLVVCLARQHMRGAPAGEKTGDRRPHG